MLKQQSGNLAKALSQSPLIIGLGPSAWPRLIPAFFFPKYRIISYYDCQDNDFIAKLGIKVYSLQKEDPNLEVSPVTPAGILATTLARRYLAKLDEPFVFQIYKSSFKLEKLCAEEGWEFLSNKKDLMEKYENKKNIKEIFRQIGVEAIPGENISIDELNQEKFRSFQAKLGQKKLVLQLAEMTYGGGSGTLFLDNASQLKLFFQRVSEIRKNFEGKKKKIESVNIAPYLSGVSASITCCATKYGTLTGPLQTQIMDIDAVGTKIPNRSGNYTGHDWCFRYYEDRIQKQAVQIARSLGQKMYQDDYKGIFGLDLIIDAKDKVWPVECNPRDTDAFPLISMLQMEKGLVPMEVFHNLEHLGLDYEIDFEKTDALYKQDFSASQIILHNPLVEKAVIDRGRIKAGIWRFANRKLNYLRPGLTISDVLHQNEYLVTEGILKKPGRFYPPSGRICRLIKRGGFLQDANNLKPEIKKVIKLFYQELNLLEVGWGLIDKKGLLELYEGKLINAKTNSDLAKADLVNIVGESEAGFFRPEKISWRKKLTSAPIISQIRSKKAGKQIVSDIRKLPNLGIKIEILPEIDQEIFAKWLGLYRKIINAKEKGEVMIGIDWLAKKRKKGKKVGAVLAFQNEEIIGGELFFEVKGRLNVAYGISERPAGLAGGLNLLLDYYFLDYSQKQGYREVSFGQDANLYGYDLSCGLLAYKVKLGFSPFPANKTYFVSTYFLNFAKFPGPIMFFSGKKENLGLVVIAEEKGEIDLNIYLPDGIELVNLYESSKILSQHRQILLNQKLVYNIGYEENSDLNFSI